MKIPTYDTKPVKSYKTANVNSITVKRSNEVIILSITTDNKKYVKKTYWKFIWDGSLEIPCFNMH